MKTPEAFEQDRTDELDALRRVLDASAPVPPLADLPRERIRAAALDARRSRCHQRFALAASVTLLLGSLPLLTFLTPPAEVPPYAEHPLVQDLLLTELDLLDLQLLELAGTFETDTLFPSPEDFL